MRRGRIFIFLILIVVVGLALLYFAYTQVIGGGGGVIQPTQTALTQVYFAAQNIPQGTTITQDMLDTLSIPPENVAEDMYTVGE
jgi:Flp pilus assembly protein CpaB